jgi:hypothetical protein
MLINGRMIIRKERKFLRKCVNIHIFYKKSKEQLVLLIIMHPKIYPPFYLINILEVEGHLYTKVIINNYLI